MSKSSWIKNTASPEKEMAPLKGAQTENKSPSMKLLYQFCDGKELSILVLGSVLTIISSVLPLLALLEFVEIMSAFSEESDSDLYDEVKLSCFLLFLTGLCMLILSFSGYFLFETLEKRVGSKWKSTYLQTILSRPISWFDKNTLQFDQEMSLIEESAGTRLQKCMSSLSLLISLGILSLLINTQLALAGFGSLVQILISLFAIEKAINRPSYTGKTTEDTFRNFKLVSAFNAQTNRVKAYQSELRENKLDYKSDAAFGWAFLYATIFGNCIIMLSLGGFMIENDHENWITGSNSSETDIVIVLLASLMASFAFRSTLGSLKFIKKGIQTSGIVNERIKDTIKHDGSSIVYSLTGNIQFKSVHFNYPADYQCQVLKGISFTANPGQVLAVVGESMSGKSTILQLILGFYYCDYGKVMIDNQDIIEYDLSSLRNFIGYVPQKPVLFSLPVKENIRLGNLNANIHTLDKIMNEMNINEEETECANSRNQKISIARALIKNPKILLMDEPFVHLKKEDEERIKGRILTNSRDKTVIIATRNADFVEEANDVVFLKNGSAVSGSHQELINENKDYKRHLVAYRKTPVIEETSSIQRIEPGEIYQRIRNTTSKYPKSMLLTCSLAVLAGSLLPLMGYFFASSIHELAKTKSVSEYMDNLIVLGIGTILIFLLVLFMCLSLFYTAGKLAYDLKGEYMATVLGYEAQFYDRTSVRSLMMNLTEDIDRMSQIGGAVSVSLCLIAGSLFCSIIIAFTNDMILGILVYIAIPIQIFLNIMVLKTQGVSQRSQDSEMSRQILAEIRTVHALNRFGYFYKLYENMKDTSDYSKSRLRGLVLGAPFFIFCVSVSSIVLLGTYRISNGDNDKESVLIVIFTMIFAPWVSILIIYICKNMREKIESAKNIFRTIDQNTNKFISEGTFKDIEGDISFDYVDFFNQNYYIHQLSLAIPKGKSICITGDNTKSSILQLLLRFYEPNGGKITIDTLDLKDYDLAHLRKSIGWVGREPVIFDGSLKENLEFSKLEASENEMNNALNIAQADDILKKFTLDGYLQCNKLRQDQIQRIAIARAIVKQPSILVLDECTECFSDTLEAKVIENLRAQNCTLVFIGNRLKNVRDFEKVIVMQEGTVIEEGTHSELIKNQEGLYQILSNQQHFY